MNIVIALIKGFITPFRSPHETPKQVETAPALLAILDDELDSFIVAEVAHFL